MKGKPVSFRILIDFQYLSSKITQLLRWIRLSIDNLLYYTLLI